MMQRVIEGDECRIWTSAEIVERFQADVDERQQRARAALKFQDCVALFAGLR